MNKFGHYTHIEESVEAIQLLPDTSSTVIKALMEPATAGELALLELVYNQETAVYDVDFRYSTDSTVSQIRATDYLVRLNDGTFKVASAEDFEVRYVNTGIDPLIPACDQQTPKGAVLRFIQTYFPTAGIESEEQLTPEALSTIMGGLLKWYNPTKDIFTIEFTDCGITNPEGLADIMNAFPSAPFIQDTTKLYLDFGNGLSKDTKDWNKPNLFNKIGLQQLVGELKKIPKEVRERLCGIDFQGHGDAESACAPSVDDETFDNFALTVMGLTGISTTSAFRR